MPFKDHFSGHASDYAAFRPSYPPELIEWLAEIAPSRRLAWDCATGNGQAALLVAQHFDRVVATDASPQQLERATPHPNVEYRIAAEDGSGLADASADLVTIAQALHWLDHDRFNREVRRVLVPGGVVAAWCYGNVTVDAANDPAIRWFYEERVGKYWPPERWMVENGYRDIEFPFEAIAGVADRNWAIRARLDRAALLGYIGTWSAVTRARQFEGRDPLPELEAALATSWPDREERCDVTWPIALRVGRVSDH